MGQLVTIALILRDSFRARSLCVSLCRWKTSTFSVNGLERCELNIDFIGSLVTAAVRSADSPMRWSRRNLLKEWVEWRDELGESGAQCTVLKKRAIRRGRGQSCSIFPVMFVLGGSVRLQQKHFLSCFWHCSKTVVIFLVVLDWEILASKHLLESQHPHCLHSYVKLRMQCIVQRIIWPT